MERFEVSRMELLRRIHRSIEQANRDLAGSVTTACAPAALDELERQRQHLHRLLAPGGDPRALLSRPA